MGWDEALKLALSNSLLVFFLDEAFLIIQLFIFLHILLGFCFFSFFFEKIKIYIIWFQSKNMSSIFYPQNRDSVVAACWHAARFRLIRAPPLRIRRPTKMYSLIFIFFSFRMVLPSLSACILTLKCLHLYWSAYMWEVTVNTRPKPERLWVSDVVHVHKTLPTSARSRLRGAISTDVFVWYISVC